jgi:hypothetical protein
MALMIQENRGVNVKSKYEFGFQNECTLLWRVVVGRSDPRVVGRRQS